MGSTEGDCNPRVARRRASRGTFDRCELCECARPVYGFDSFQWQLSSSSRVGFEGSLKDLFLCSVSALFAGLWAFCCDKRELIERWYQLMIQKVRIASKGKNRVKKFEG